MIRLLVALLLMAAPASAHSWYPRKCCSDRDCAPVAPDSITCNADGCDVTIVPGTHPMVPGDGPPVTLHTTKQPEISPDGQHHACIGFGMRVLCLFYGGSI